MTLSKKIKEEEVWVLYILRCGDKSLYTGITKDLRRRLEEHISQGKKCAKYLRGKDPIKLVYQESIATKSEALKREIEIKSLLKSEKETLVKKSVA